MTKAEKIVVGVCVTAWVLAVCAYFINIAHQPPPEPFTDTVGHLLAEDIEDIHREGLTSGCGPNIFCPDDLLTRADASVFALRLEHGADYEPPQAVGLFADMQGHWGERWAEAAYNEGLMTSCAEGFCPDEGISRAMGAMLLNRR